MHLPTIHTSPSDRPKFDFLQIHNFLGEFRSEIDKARVRYNLGIPDEYSLTWENITGQIATNTALVDYINNSFSGTKSKVDALITSVNALNTSNTSLVNKVSDLETASGSYTSLAARLTALETDVNLNAALIKTLSGGSGSSIDLSGYATLSWVTSLGYALASNLASLESRVSTLESQLNGPTLNSITASQTSVLLTPGGYATIIITGNYSNGTTLNVTNSCLISYSTSGIVSYADGTITAAAVGNTIATFTHTSGLTCTVTIEVTESETDPSYIGYAMTYNEVYEDPDCKVTNIKSQQTYNNIKEVTEAPYFLWIITTSTITYFKESNTFEYDIPGDNIELTSTTLNGKVYNIYKFHGDEVFGNTGELNGTTTITITTN